MSSEPGPTMTTSFAARRNVISNTLAQASRLAPRLTCVAGIGFASVVGSMPRPVVSYGTPNSSSRCHVRPNSIPRQGIEPRLRPSHCPCYVHNEDMYFPRTFWRDRTLCGSEDFVLPHARARSQASRIFQSPSSDWSGILVNPRPVIDDDPGYTIEIAAWGRRLDSHCCMSSGLQNIARLAIPGSCTFRQQVPRPRKDSNPVRGMSFGGVTCALPGAHSAVFRQ